MPLERFDELQLTGKLPSPHGVGLRLLQLSQRGDASLDEVVQVLATDPTLTGRLLKLANSAQSTGVQPAATAKEAALRLGLRTVFAVSLSFSLVAASRDGRCAAFDYDGFWSRSLAAAAAAQAIATLTGELPAGEAFTAALLGRIGRLALASIHPEEYATVLEACRDLDSAALTLAERKAFGTDHHELGAALLAHWRVPHPMVEAVSLAGEPPQDGTDELVAAHARHLVFARDVSRAMCAASDEAPSACAARLAELARVREALGLTVEEFDELWDEIVALWREWGALMEVPASPELPLAELAARAASDPEGPPAALPRADRDACPVLDVLVVEDDPVSARVLVAQLTKQGHRVRSAKDGRAGLSEALHAMPDVVVSDWMMPGMDGVEMTRALRASTAGQQVHVILLTGRDDDERVVEAFDGGVDEYLTKPVNPGVLMARLRAAARTIGLRKRVEELADERERQLARYAILARKLQVASLTDPLTGLPNRRCALERLTREARDAARTGRAFSVLMLDIDHFKAVNDAHGHDAGDAVLCGVAAAVRGAVRRGDLVCRIGGEEFLVLCPGADEGVAVAIAERVRSQVAARRFAHESFRDSVTISLGTAVWQRDGATVDALLKCADRRLYEAKRAGRDRAVTDDRLAQAG